MDSGLGPLPNMDAHDPSSVCGPSPSLHNSSLGGLTQGVVPERCDGDGDREGPESVLPKPGPYGNNQKKPRSSAFPSSLTWDSDSEKETFDEEELQNFSNPHGLAAHSPGSPTCVQEHNRLDCGGYETAEKSRNQLFENNLTSPMEGGDQGRDDTFAGPSTAQFSNKHHEESKEGHEKEEDEPKESDPKKEEQNIPERDVYSFPGDSDPESPPPGPWAHCTFIQRRRKKRALLRPFSGLGPWQRTTGTGRKSRTTPLAKEHSKVPNSEGGRFEFKEEERVLDEERVQTVGEELCQDIFTCVECSVYFKKRTHLREHMREHTRDHGCAAGGSKGPRGEGAAARRRVRKSGFECMECGQEFTDKLLLVNHHQQHQDSRRRILEEMGKLSDGGQGAKEQAGHRRAARAAVKESPADCGQFVCLKCNYSSDLPQELADHARTHVARARTGVHRASSRIQQKSRRKGPAKKDRHSRNGAASVSATPAGERYPTRASVQTVEQQIDTKHSQARVCDPQGKNEAEPFPATSQDHLASTTPTGLPDRPETVSVRTDAAPHPVPSLQGESGSGQTGLAEENVPKAQSPVPVASGSKTVPRRREVAFKSTGNRRSKRLVRDLMGRTRASSRLGPQPADSSESRDPNAKAAAKQGQKEASIHEQNTDSKRTAKADGLETPALALQLKRSFSANLQGATERLDLAEGQQAQLRHKLPLVLINALSSDLPTALSYGRAMGEDSSAMASGLNTSSPPPKIIGEAKEEMVPLDNNDKSGEDTIETKDDDSDDDDDDNIDEDDVVNHLLDVLTEEEDEDEEGVALKSVGRKCPYCPDHFDNGIGLANHIRGHLNRVGVSYNVRHFISPEEVNAIEKKFSYQKKKKKVANFDPTTFSVMRCELCSAGFDTRAGLSSHARAHLRDFGITNWEVTVSPINVLRELFSKRPDLALSALPRACSEVQEQDMDREKEEPVSDEDEDDDEDEDEEAPGPVAQTSHTLPWKEEDNDSEPEGGEDEREGMLVKMPPVDSFASGPGVKNSFPLQTEDSAPVEETELKAMEVDPNKDIICKLCGAWFETRKGLSSHARAHLRHFGVEYSESKGSPIDLLNRLILTDDFKQRATSLLSDIPEDLRVHGSGVVPPSPSTSTSTSTASKRPLQPSSLLFKPSSLGSGIGSKATAPSSGHTLLGPPTKKLKPSSQQVFRLSGREMMPIPLAEPMKDVGCEFCGELFENRKGLSSHARSHLRQLGITEWSVNGSPIDTLREIIARRGLPCAMPPKPLKSPSTSPGPPRSSLPSSSPPGGAHGRLTFPFGHHSSSQHQPTARKMAASVAASSNCPTVVIVKPKPEPEHVEVTMTRAGTGGHESYSSDTLHPSWRNSDNTQPINLVMTQEREPSRDIRCEFCGEFFENRKGLSSHARSHLRHMGITEWSVNGSPIDTLWEVMRKQGTTPASVALGVKEEPQHANSAPWDGHGYQSPKVSRKSPLNLLHSTSRHHKHGLGTPGLSTTPPAGKFFGMTPLGKRMLGTEGHLGERSPPAQSKVVSPLPQDFSFKGKVSTDKQGVCHMDASCELCGFFFENRKALASHARAHLRQFGVTEWCVNGSPIETLSAWMRSRPQTVAELHRTYLQSGRSIQKKKGTSLSPSSDSDPMPPVSRKSSAAQWASLTLSQTRTVRQEAMSSRTWGSSSREVKSGSCTSSQHGTIAQGGGHHSNSALPHAQVAKSELNVRLPRGIERRPLKHPSHADGGERESCPPKPPRTSTVPALVPKPPSTPLVKLVGKIYSLKCRFCDVEFHGPLSVQEDWIRHLQQHILNLNYNKPAPTATSTPAKPDAAASQTQSSATTSTSTTTITTPDPTSVFTLTPTPIPTPASTPTPTPTPTSTAPPVAIAGGPTTAELVLTPAT
ncbi:protein Wiz isoform X4 [Brachyhypopomus gauderio]|uniref:protein Wiz isoform X4 n=1 Tax=Brachyhypopomus gauderio TaxID=698409 RepID=UPI0040421C49